MAALMQQVFLTTNQGNICVEVPCDGTVFDIKKAVLETRCIPLEDQRIVFAGGVAKDDTPIKEYYGQTNLRLIIKP